MAVAHGFPDYPFVVIPHPINATPYETLDLWVEESLSEIVRLLVASSFFYHSNDNGESYV